MVSSNKESKQLKQWLLKVRADKARWDAEAAEEKQVTEEKAAAEAKWVTDKYMAAEVELGQDETLWSIKGLLKQKRWAKGEWLTCE